MSLLPETKSLLEQVERLTNRPVDITEDPTLNTLANMQIARGNAPLHQLRYKPMGTNKPDYYIAYQCGFVIRLLSTPGGKCFDLGVSEKASVKMDELLADRSLPPEVRGMKDHFLDGILTQLRSIPIGLRVDQWLMDSYPNLKEL